MDKSYFGAPEKQILHFLLLLLLLFYHFGFVFNLAIVSRVGCRSLRQRADLWGHFP